MRLVEQGALRYFQFETFDATDVAQGIFTRHGGVSPEPYASLNMSVSTGDAPENVRQNAARAFGVLARDPGSCADLWQVHSARVLVAERPNGPTGHQGQADALITNPPQVSLFFRFADCLPVFISDPKQTLVGLGH